MQQTEIYQFNKIDMDDTFSPDPINENAEKVEAALADMEDRLGGRITTLEGRRLATGVYSGTYNKGGTNSSIDRTIHLGFTPALVLISNRTHNIFAGLALPGSPVLGSAYDRIRIVSGGFYVSEDFNQSGTTYHYFALL